MTKQKWKTIIGCTNYAIGSHGQVKRLKHRARGKNHKILPEVIMKQIYSMSFKPTVRIVDDDGRQRELSVEKLVITYFLVPNKTYYKIVSSNRINRVDCYIDSDVYERIKYKPVIYKTIKS